MEGTRQGAFSYIWEKFGTVIILIGLLISIGVMSPKYLTLSNLTQIAVQSSIFMLLGMSELFAILTAGIDLSVSSTLALTGATVALMLSNGASITQAVLIGAVGLGALLGFINGSIIAFSGLPPFIVTLGTLNIYRGLTLVITEGRPIYRFPYEFNLIFGGNWFEKIPAPLAVAGLCAIGVHLLLKYTTVGRCIYAVGGNVKAAWLSGVRVKFTLIIAYTMSGLIAGFAGILMVARVGAAEPLAGSGYELFGIAATIIGGTSFFGGIGSVPNTLIGALVIGSLNNALNMLGVQTYYQQVVSGIVIVVTVLANKLLVRRGQS